MNLSQAVTNQLKYNGKQFRLWKQTLESIFAAKDLLEAIQDAPVSLSNPALSVEQNESAGSSSSGQQQATGEVKTKTHDTERHRRIWKSSEESISFTRGYLRTASHSQPPQHRSTSRERL